MDINPTKVSVVLPTYNERENIAELVGRIRSALGKEAEILVVDDDSPDGTWQVVEELTENDPRLQLLRRTRERGLTSAIAAGVSHAQEDIVAWMDCDLSMPPEVLPRLVKALVDADIALGSRYIAGGGDVGHSLMAQSFSRTINLAARLLLGWGIHDYTSGFIAARRDALKALPLQGDYGEYCIALIHQARRAGFRLVEIPYLCLPRKGGASKTAVSFWGFIRRGVKYVQTILRLRFWPGGR